MPFPFSPKFVYNLTGTPVTLTLTMTQGIWTPDREYMGSGSESSAGIPETWIQRKRGILATRIRFTEPEWSSIVTMFDWIMDAGSAGIFNFYPDQSLSTYYACYLLKPTAGDRLAPERVAGYPRVYELPIEIRTVNNSIFDVRLA